MKSINSSIHTYTESMPTPPLFVNQASRFLRLASLPHTPSSYSPPIYSPHRCHQEPHTKVPPPPLHPHHCRAKSLPPELGCWCKKLYRRAETPFCPSPRSKDHRRVPMPSPKIRKRGRHRRPIPLPPQPQEAAGEDPCRPCSTLS
jgi:hypothetical protein